MATPDKQIPAQPLLQLPHVVADGRLRHAQLGRRTRETQVTRGGVKGAQGAKRRQASHQLD